MTAGLLRANTSYGFGSWTESQDLPAIRAPIILYSGWGEHENKISLRTGTRHVNIREQIESLFDGNESFENKDKVDSKTVMMALSVARLFPGIENSPSIGATPQGEIDLDWSPARDVVFVIAISPKETVVFAGSVEGVSFKSEYEIKNMDKLPDFVYSIIEYVGNMNER